MRLEIPYLANVKTDAVSEQGAMLNRLGIEPILLFIEGVI
jgi:hypothetical protein